MTTQDQERAVEFFEKQLGPRCEECRNHIQKYGWSVELKQETVREPSIKIEVYPETGLIPGKSPESFVKFTHSPPSQIDTWSSFKLRAGGVEDQKYPILDSVMMNREDTMRRLKDCLTTFVQDLGIEEPIPFK